MILSWDSCTEPTSSVDRVSSSENSPGWLPSLLYSLISKLLVVHGVNKDLLDLYTSFKE